MQKNTYTKIIASVVVSTIAIFAFGGIMPARAANVTVKNSVTGQILSIPADQIPFMSSQWSVVPAPATTSSGSTTSAGTVSGSTTTASTASVTNVTMWYNGQCSVSAQKLSTDVSYWKTQGWSTTNPCVSSSSTTSSSSSSNTQTPVATTTSNTSATASTSAASGTISVSDWMTIVNNAKYVDGTLFKDQTGTYWYKRQGTIRNVATVSQLQQLAKDGMVIPGSDVNIILTGSLAPAATTSPVAAPATSGGTTATTPATTTVPAGWVQVTDYADWTTNYVNKGITSNDSITVGGKIYVNPNWKPATSSNTGVFSATKDVSSPNDQIVSGSTSNVVLGAYKFTSTNENINLTNLSFKFPAINGLNGIQNVKLIDGGNVIQTVPLTGEKGFTQSANFAVNYLLPANTVKVLKIAVDLGKIGDGAGVSGTEITPTLSSVTYKNSAGTAISGTIENGVANHTYVYKAFPSISGLSLPTTTLALGTQTLAKFRVTANGGNISLKQFVFDIAETTNTSLTITNPSLWIDGISQDVYASVNTASIDQKYLGIKFDFKQEKEIAGGAYAIVEVRGIIGGTIITSGNAISTMLKYSGLPAYHYPVAYVDANPESSSVIWSDQAAANHTELTTDWMNDYLVRDPSTWILASADTSSVTVNTTNSTLSPGTQKLTSATATTPATNIANTTLYWKDGSSTQVPNADVSYWAKQGWSTINPKAVTASTMNQTAAQLQSQTSATASQTKQTQTSVLTSAVSVANTTVYWKDGSSTQIPNGDVNFWMKQGWSTTNPKAAKPTTEELQSQVAALVSQVAAQQQTQTGNSASSVVLAPSQDLSLGSRGDAVTSLQNFLVAQNKGPAAQALAAMPRGYFGAATQTALIEFQKAVGISPASGAYDAKTRAYISLLNSTMAVTPETPSATIAVPGVLKLTSATTTMAPATESASATNSTTSDSTITVYWKDGSSTQIPKGDLDFWVKQGWSITNPKATISVAPVTSDAPATNNASAKDLTLGSRGQDVIDLQNFLITQNKGPAAQALAMQPQGYFGTLTKAALIEFQKAIGISPADGYFGNNTKEYIAAVIARNPYAKSPVIKINAQTEDKTNAEIVSIVKQIQAIQLTEDANGQISVENQKIVETLLNRLQMLQQDIYDIQLLKNLINVIQQGRGLLINTSATTGARATETIAPATAPTTVSPSITVVNNGKPETISAPTPSANVYPTVTLLADKTAVKAGDPVTLSWSSNNAALCSWNLPDNSLPDQRTSGTKVFYPRARTIYEMTCFDGSPIIFKSPLSGKSKQVIVDIIPATAADLPVVSLAANTANIKKGDTVYLAWYGSNADYCKPMWKTVDVGYLLSGKLNGSSAERPDVTTSYFVYCQNKYGEKYSNQVTVNVSNPVSSDTKVFETGPQIDLRVNGNKTSAYSLTKGDGATLIWNAPSADRCKLQGDLLWGDNAGSKEVAPDKTTTYTIQCGYDGTSTSFSAERYGLKATGPDSIKSVAVHVSEI